MIKQKILNYTKLHSFEYVLEKLLLLFPKAAGLSIYRGQCEAYFTHDPTSKLTKLKQEQNWLSLSSDCSLQLSELEGCKTRDLNHSSIEILIILGWLECTTNRKMRCDGPGLPTNLPAFTSCSLFSLSSKHPGT